MREIDLEPHPPIIYTRANLYKAIAGMQQEIPPIYKGTQGYSYKYADWGQILEVVNDYASKYKLGFTQLIDGTNLKTVIFHTETGESIESIAAIPQGVQLKGMNDFQVMGSAITYMRRYALSAALGLVTDEDADAAGEQLKKERKANTDFKTPGADQEILARAKASINKQLEEQGYDTAVSKLAFVNSVIKKEVITTLDEADLIADALDNE